MGKEEEKRRKKGKKKKAETILTRSQGEEGKGGQPAG